MIALKLLKLCFNADACRHCKSANIILLYLSYLGQ